MSVLGTHRCNGGIRKSGEQTQSLTWRLRQKYITVYMKDLLPRSIHIRHKTCVVPVSMASICCRNYLAPIRIYYLYPQARILPPWGNRQWPRGNLVWHLLSTTPQSQYTSSVLHQCLLYVGSSGTLPAVPPHPPKKASPTMDSSPNGPNKLHPT